MAWDKHLMHIERRGDTFTWNQEDGYERIHVYASHFTWEIPTRELTSVGNMDDEGTPEDKARGMEALRAGIAELYFSQAQINPVPEPLYGLPPMIWEQALKSLGFAKTLMGINRWAS